MHRLTVNILFKNTVIKTMLVRGADDVRRDIATAVALLVWEHTVTYVQ